MSNSTHHTFDNLDNVISQKKKKNTNYPKLTQYRIDNLNSPINTKETEFVI